jgi:transketolase
MLDLNNIRKNILLALAESQSGHLGGSLGSLEMQTLLASQITYDKRWYTKSKHLDFPHKLSLATKMRAGRDKFILSAGHLSPALYAVWAELGLYDELIEAQQITGFNEIDKRTEYLKTIRDVYSDLEGHPSLVHNPYLVDTSTGPLGQGAGTSVGFALHDMRAVKSPADAVHTYVLLGDGECQEGQVWEAAMNASKFGLSNLTWVVDRNFIQIDGDTESVGGLDMNFKLSDDYSGLANKFLSFGFIVEENIEGNDYKECAKYLERIKRKQLEHERPGVIINYTKVGYPFSQFGTYKWHGKTPTEQEAIKAISELNKQ